MTQYATGPDFAKKYDVRLCGDLVSDSGTKVTELDFPTNPNLLDALVDAGAMIDGAVRVGNRYTPAQMANLEASAATLVRRLCCDQALVFLKRRRGRIAETDKTLLEEVEQRMKSLRSGDDYLMLATETSAEGSMIELAGPCLIPIGAPAPLRTIRESVPDYYPIMRGRWPNGRCGCE